MLDSLQYHAAPPKRVLKNPESIDKRGHARLSLIKAGRDFEKHYQKNDLQ